MIQQTEVVLQRMGNVVQSICRVAILVTEGDFNSAGLIAERYFDDAILLIGGKRLPVLFGRQRLYEC